MPHIGAPEAIIVLVVVLIVFGVGRLPQVGGALGKGIREFRKGKSGILEDLDEEVEVEEEKPKRKKQATKTKEVYESKTK